MDKLREPGDANAAAHLGLVPSVKEILDEVAAEAGLLPGSLDDTFTPGATAYNRGRYPTYPPLSTARLLA